MSKVIVICGATATGKSDIAIEVAQNKNFAGIILEAPFTSLVEVAQKNYPFFPVQFILQDKFIFLLSFDL